jgi:hypothetical protein
LPGDNWVQRVQQNAFHIWENFISIPDSSGKIVASQNALGGNRCQRGPGGGNCGVALLDTTGSNQKSSLG